MTVADERRQLEEDDRRAREALTAVRREIEETVAGRGGHVDVALAEEYRRRLEAAQERVREVALALRALRDDG